MTHNAIRSRRQVTPQAAVCARVVPDSVHRRNVDIFVGVTGLVLCSPVLLVLAVMVRRSSEGPALYSQIRVGRDGEPFALLKLRTMVHRNDKDWPLITGHSDSRVTPVGRWLRTFRLDELPQLINLVRGDVTLLGPRPEVPRFLPYYTTSELEVLRVRPGIIGPGALWFVHTQEDRFGDSRDPETEYVETILHPKLAKDLEYLMDRTLRRDLALLLGASRVLVRGR